MSDKEVEELEAKEEELAKDGEIMELANPDDEQDESESSSNETN